MNFVLMDALLDQMEKGQQINSKFTKIAFTGVVVLMGLKNLTG